MKSITFTNACAVPSWMPEHKKKFREEANVYITNALSQVPFLKDHDVEVTYFLQGVGSIVAKIVSSAGDVYVMKTTESFNHTSKEISTYKACSDTGIKVPQLFFEGMENGLPFFLMEYFGEGTLGDKLDTGEMSLDEVAHIKANFFCDLKKIEGKGYNWPITYTNGVLEGNFKDIDEFMTKWFCGEDLIEIANKHFPDSAWKDELYRHVQVIKDANAGRLCKLGTFDFQTGHVFASNPPTLFDPCLKLEPEYCDLAQLIIPFPGGSERDVVLNKVVFSVYQERFGVIDVDVFLSALWLQTYRKATNQLMHADEARTKRGLHGLAMIANEDSLREYIAGYVG